MIENAVLQRLYTQNKLSMMEIAAVLDCSHHQVVYWMKKYEITRRSISEAVYQKHNPNGDPFTIQPIDTVEKAKLYGIGIGLYWGEGTKANKYAVRLGNTDPELLNTFIRFLIELFDIDKEDLRFGLQIFTDIKQDAALEYWSTALGIHQSQFYKVHVTISGSIGNYRKKSRYGVVTVYYHNKRLRDILVEMLPR